MSFYCIGTENNLEHLNSATVHGCGGKNSQIDEVELHGRKKDI